MSFLNWLELLNDLTQEERDNLEVFCQERFLQVWELLFREWESASSMYILKQWELEVFVEKDWEEVILWNIIAEDIVWEMALFLDRDARMANARAIEDSTVITLLDFSIKELTDKHPEILEKINKIIEDRKVQNEGKLI